MIYLFEQASTLYFICINAKNHGIWLHQDKGYFVALNVWSALHVTGLIALVAVSESTANKVIRILGKSKNNFFVNRLI